MDAVPNPEMEVSSVVQFLVDAVETEGIRFSLDIDRAAVVAWDTETTSLHGVAIQIGVVALDVEGRELLATSRILSPLGYPIDPRAFAVHGIPQERLEEEGEPAGKCVSSLVDLASRATSASVHFVAHNSAFDIRAIRKTADAAGVSFPSSFSSFCTMNAGKRAMEAVGRGSKRPKNGELYEALVGPVPKETILHDAVGDARLTAHSFLAGRRVGLW